MAECGCKIIRVYGTGTTRPTSADIGSLHGDYIEYCPLHAAAEKMRDALEYVLHESGIQDNDIGMFLASSDESIQRRTYHCWGCNAEGIASWPNWEVQFEHMSNCKFLAAHAVLAAARGEKP